MCVKLHDASMIHACLPCLALPLTHDVARRLSCHRLRRRWCTHPLPLVLQVGALFVREPSAVMSSLERLQQTVDWLRCDDRHVLGWRVAAAGSHGRLLAPGRQEGWWQSRRVVAAQGSCPAT